jgi:hypothetical protein
MLAHSIQLFGLIAGFGFDCSKLAIDKRRGKFNLPVMPQMKLYEPLWKINLKALKIKIDVTRAEITSVIKALRAHKIDHKCLSIKMGQVCDAHE